MNLQALQTDFCAYMLDRPNALEPEIDGDLAVYYHAYRAQLLTCLRDTFEKTWSWLGDERFEEAARTHIEAHPPRSWTMNVYGEGFDATLARLHPEDPEVAELAWLEWTLRRAFDGQDADPVDRARLADIDWDNAVLDPVPTLRLGTVTTNCAAIWSALSQEQTPPAAARLPVPAAIRVWRQGLSVQFRSIDPIEEQALRLILDGCDFAEICARSESPDEIGRILGLWLQDGVIAEITDHPADRLPMSE
jgi:hypothetical protein